MQRRNLSKLIASTVVASGFCIGAPRQASAVPVNGQYVEDPRCDAIPTQSLTHELGDIVIFPLNESISYQASPVTFTVCVQNDGLANDWVVRMQNTSGIAWKNLFFVVDHGGFVGNADGNIRDVALAPNDLSDAFSIDGTVTNGLNNNLLSESMAVDEIFQPGEFWTFAVSNYSPLNSAGVFSPPIFSTPGVFSGSSPLNTTSGNASILATPAVPEPATMSVLALGAAALLLRRRRSSASVA